MSGSNGSPLRNPGFRRAISVLGALLLLLAAAIGGACDQKSNATPDITSTALSTGTQNSAYSYDVEAADLDSGDKLVFSLEAAPSGMTIDANTGVISWTPGQSGTFSVTAKVKDAAGASDTQTFSIVIADAAPKGPTISSTAITTGKQGEAYSYDVQVSESGTMTFTLDQAPAGMTIDAGTGLIRWTPAQAGSFSVIVKVKDATGGSDTQTFSITVTEGSKTPRITSTAVTMAKEGEAYTYDVQASDADGAKFRLDQAPAGMTIDANTGVITWTPDTAAVGTASVTVRVSNEAGLSDSQTFTITVESVVKKYAVIYGISDYLNLTPDDGDLTYCDEDANSWYLYLSSRGYECKVYGHLKASDYSLYSGTATEYNVSHAVRDMVAKADSNDYLCFIASGHAMPGDDLNEAALVMHDYGTPEGGMDGLYWDTELAADFEDCVAAQTFIYVDACLADAMGEVFSAPRSGHVMMVASSMGTPYSESWDYPQYSHGAWTYFFLLGGVQGTGHQTFDLAQVFTWAKEQYRVWYTDPGIGLGNPSSWWNNYDQPVIHDSDPGTKMYL